MRRGKVADLQGRGKAGGPGCWEEEEEGGGAGGAEGGGEGVTRWADLLSF